MRMRGPGTKALKSSGMRISQSDRFAAHFLCRERRSFREWPGMTLTMSSRRELNGKRPQVDTGRANQMCYAYYLEHAMRRVTAREPNQRFSEVFSAVETG